MDKSAFGIEHVEKKIDKDSVSYKANVVNRDVMHPKFGGNGKYDKTQRKRARKIMSRESSKAEMKYGGRGAGIGAAAGGVGAGIYGAAKGGAKGAKANSAVGAIVGGVAGFAGGSKYSEPIGRTNGIKRYQKEFGKNLSESAFGVEHEPIEKSLGSSGVKALGRVADSKPSAFVSGSPQRSMYAKAKLGNQQFGRGMKGAPGAGGKQFTGENKRLMGNAANKQRNAPAGMRGSIQGR